MKLSPFKIKQIRLEMGMSQHQMAQKMGFKQGTISKMESGALVLEVHHQAIIDSYNQFLHQRIAELEEELRIVKAKIIADSPITADQAIPTKSANGDYLLSVKHLAIRTLYDSGYMTDEAFNKWMLSEDPSFTPEILKQPIR